jgi:hypothetical protein
MDYGSLATTIAIVVYGAVEYRRRERLHRAELAMVRRGEIPSPREPRHPLTSLMTIGGAAALILVSEGILLYMGSRFPRNISKLAVIGVIFLFMLFALSLMFFRDLRRYRARRRAGGSAQ